MDEADHRTGNHRQHSNRNNLQRDSDEAQSHNRSCPESQRLGRSSRLRLHRDMDKIASESRIRLHSIYSTGEYDNPDLCSRLLQHCCWR